MDFDKNATQILSCLTDSSDSSGLPIQSASLGLAVVRHPNIKFILEEFGFRPDKISSSLQMHVLSRNIGDSDECLSASGINLSVRADNVLKRAARKVHLRRNYPEIKPKDLLVALASEDGITRKILESYGTQNRLALVYAYTNS